MHEFWGYLTRAWYSAVRRIPPAQNRTPLPPPHRYRTQGHPPPIPPAIRHRAMGGSFPRWGDWRR